MAHRSNPGEPDHPSPKDRFITVYGRMPVLEVLADEDLEVDKVLVADTARGPNLDKIRRAAQARGVPVQQATAHRVKLLAGNGKHDQGVIADVVAPRMTTLSRFVDALEAGSHEEPQRVLVLDRLTNPANIGMVLRTATAAGISAVVLPHRGSPGIDPLVIKASAGVAYRASVVRCGTAAEALSALRAAGFTGYGLSGTAPVSLYAATYPTRAAFVLGNETDGVTDACAALVDAWLAIPMAGRVESLNVASAAAVLCFELARRDTEG